jgi:regulator of replication initiation timing
MQEMTDVKAAVTKAENSKDNMSLRQEADKFHAESFHICHFHEQEKKSESIN